MRRCENIDIMTSIRRCPEDERNEILAIINAAAEVYRDTIPQDRWHDPYMPLDQLEAEIAAGVEFWGYETESVLAGVMGIQPVRDVDLIRHAYVRPGLQGQGVGRALLDHLRSRSTGQMLVGTWADAVWAIRFYQRHGFTLVSPELKSKLLRIYWTIPERQVETSVVLASPSMQES
jgi:GNAT superfamily N-acetyltransferase